MDMNLDHLGQAIKFDGFLKVYNFSDDEEKGDFKAFPNLKENDIAKLIDLKGEQSFTKPPARYTEASLVKVLEENGIGRPSTYSPTINTIIARRYIKKEKKNLLPTDLGFTVTEIMEKYFENIVDTKFTANVEDELDKIAEGDIFWKEVLRKFYTPFSKDLKEAEKNIEKVEQKIEYSDELCPNCGKKMQYKMGRFGRFLACSGYPECKTTKAIIKTIDEKCPKCGGKIIVNKTKKGGRTFYVCENNRYTADKKDKDKNKKEDKNSKDKNKKEDKQKQEIIKDEDGKIVCDYISWNKPSEKDKDNKKKDVEDNEE